MDDSVALLILVHNKAAYTRRCLASLFHSTLRPFQVVLVDNGSSDETAEVLAEFTRRAGAEGIAAEVLRLPENRGAVEGRNLGLDRLRGDFWVFLDNDVTVRSRRWLEELRAGLQAEPRAGICGPKLVYPLPPYAIQCAGCYVTRGGMVGFSGRGAPREAPEWNRPRACQALISACWMMPAGLARRLGPLDPLFSPVQYEDIDYCYRARAAGRLCLYNPAVEMYHFDNVTTGRSPALNYSYLTVKNGLKFKEKWRERCAAEDGPPDETWSWAAIPTVALEEVAEELPLLG